MLKTSRSWSWYVIIKNEVRANIVNFYSVLSEDDAVAVRDWPDELALLQVGGLMTFTGLYK